MLIVPWILARESVERDRSLAVRGAGASPGFPFSSDRERRLWFWALVVMLAIFSTMGAAPVLAEALRERNLLRVSFAAVLVVVGAVVAARWVKRRPSGREIGVGLGVAAAYLMVLVRIPIPEERTHLFEYGLVAILVYHALNERRQHGRRVPAPAVLAIVVTALLGWLDEGIQAFLPSRVYDIRDVVFNGLAGIMAVVSSLVMRLARRGSAEGRSR